MGRGKGSGCPYCSHLQSGLTLPFVTAPVHDMAFADGSGEVSAVGGINAGRGGSPPKGKKKAPRDAALDCDPSRETGI